MPKWDNSTAYWRRLVASITRRVRHACINHRATLSLRYPCSTAVCSESRAFFFFFSFLFFGRRKPYQSEIRKDTTPGWSSRAKIEYPHHRRSWLITVYGIWYLVLGDAICWERPRVAQRVRTEDMSRISSDTRVGWLWEKAYVGIARSNLSVRERLRRCFVDCWMTYRTKGEDCVKF